MTKYNPFTAIEDLSAMDSATSTDKRESHSNVIAWTMVGIFVLIIISSYLYSKTKRFINDFYRLGASIMVAVYIHDFLSDVLFTADIRYEPEWPSPTLKWIYGLYIFFMVISAIVAWAELYYHTRDWKKNVEFSVWFAQFGTFLYIVSVITGSARAGVELCSTNLFNQRAFDIPLDVMQLREHRIKLSSFLIVLLEVCFFFMTPSDILDMT